MATKHLGELRTSSPWGVRTEFSVLCGGEHQENRYRVTVAVFTGAASVNAMISANECRKLAALLLAAAQEIEAPACPVLGAIEYARTAP
jgi:hypothetical protein